jgi:hypothetical protein
MCPSNAFNSVADVLILGEPMEFQEEINMMQVEAPSSTIVQNMFLSIVHTLIWKDTWWKSPWVTWNESKVIKLNSKGSTLPMVENKDFHCMGKLWRNSNRDMAHGAWAMSSIML